MGVLDDGWHGDRPVSDVPFTLRRRVNWGDGDAARIVYTAKFVDFALEAADCWWEAVLGLNWYQLNVEHDRGTPLVAMRFDFERPLRPGDRVDLTVGVEKLGRASLALRVDGVKVGGTKVGGEHCFSAVLTEALTVPSRMTATAFPDDFRRRIEGYARECALRDGGVRSKREVLDFWFGPPGSPARGTMRDVWFRPEDPDVAAAFDQAIRDGFTATYEAAARGDLDHWMATADGALALTIVLDQFPRNMFRNSPQAYATDAKARAVLEHVLARGFDRDTGYVDGMFFYLPLEHSEDLDHQRRSVALFDRFKDDPAAERGLWAVRRHFEIIERFGRFPHRNDCLGRESTAEELAFLEEPDSSF